jgi:MerR family transcriptional regulator, copper efflux regulator
MRIGELAERAGVSTKTVRYYESIGLLPAPDRTASGYREYDADASDRLGFIRDAQASGLSLAEIASILELKDQGRRSCEHTRDLVRRRLGEIDDQIERLLATRRELVVLAERAESVDPADCTDPHRCQVIEGHAH